MLTVHSDRAYKWVTPGSTFDRGYFGYYTTPAIFTDGRLPAQFRAIGREYPSYPVDAATVEIQFTIGGPWQTVQTTAGVGEGGGAMFSDSEEDEGGPHLLRPIHPRMGLTLRY